MKNGFKYPIYLYIVCTFRNTYIGIVRIYINNQIKNKTKLGKLTENWFQTSQIFLLITSIYKNQNQQHYEIKKQSVLKKTEENVLHNKKSKQNSRTN